MASAARRTSRTWDGPWVLPALLALAAGLRLATLGDQSLWLDEDATRLVVAEPLGEALRLVAARESTPPLYYAAAWVWTHAFGTGDTALRSLSALAGIAFVAVAYAYGRRLAGRGCGLAVAAIAAVHPLLVWYSMEARAYMPALLLSGLGWLAFLRVLDRPGPREVGWWALATGLAACTHYTTAYFALVQGAWMFKERRRARGPLLVAATALALLGLALSPIAAVQTGDGRQAWMSAIPLGDRLEAVVREFLAGPALPTWHPAAWTAAVAAAAVALALRRPDRRRVLLPGALALLAIALTLVVREAGGDYVLGRNLIFAWLPLAAVVAAGLTALPWRWASIAAVGAACGLLGAITLDNLRDDRLQRPDWRAVAAALGPAREPRLVLAPGGWAGLPLARYLGARDMTTAPAARVREVVAIGARTDSFVRACGAGALCGMGPSRPGPGPVAGLQRVSERTAAGGRFLIVTYRAPEPVSIDAGAVAGFGVGVQGQPVPAFLQVP